MKREKLAQFIFWKRSFTEDELAQTWGGAARSQPDVEPPHSLHDFLENLLRLGVLSFEGGRYSLRNPAKERRQVAA